MDTSPDIVGPVISSFSISPIAVDVTSSSQAITATAHLTDDKSGVASVMVEYRSPSGTQSIDFMFAASSRTSGTAKDGEYATTTDVDTYREAGAWHVSQATTRDVVGNTGSYTAADALGLGAVPFTVTSSPTPDTIAPEITQIRVAPHPLNVSLGDGFPTFQWDATDTGGSGVWYVNMGLTSPSGRQYVSAQAYDPGTVGHDAVTLSGAGMTGTFTPAAGFWEYGLSRYSEPGAWTVNYVQVMDRARNTRQYSSGLELDAILATSPFFAVASDPTDTGSPVISAFRFSPASIDVSTAPATVAVAFDVADDLSGVQAAWLTFRSPTIATASPTSLQRSATYFQYLTDTRITGATVHASVTFPTYDRGGDWTVAALCVIDRVKHQVCYTGSALVGLGPTTITVVANEAPTVTVTGVTDGATYSTAPTPACTVIDREDGTVSGVLPVISGPDGSGTYTATCSYTDTGGKTGSQTVTYSVDTVVVANTAPAVSVTGVGDAASYEFGAVPPAGCHWTDAEDGSGSVAVTLGAVSGPLAAYGLGTQTASCLYTDTGGLTASASVTYTIVDTTKPTISASLDRSPAATTDWFNAGTGAPTVVFTCSDTASGIATCPASHLFGNGADQGFSGTATDNAGNAASAGVTGVNVDLLAPTLNVSGPADGATLDVCALPTRPTFAPADTGGSGLASHSDTWTPPTGGSVGAYVYSAQAADLAGNTTTETRTYHVAYGGAFSGYLQPINTDGSSRFKLGSTVPVKFRLACNGLPISTAVAQLYVAQGDSKPDPGVDEAISTAASTTGNLFRYDATAGQYIFNLSTKLGYTNPGGGVVAFSAGTWTLKIKLDDGTWKSINIQLVK